MPQTATEWTPKEAHFRMLARFVREVLAGGTFESLADLSAAVKELCARRKIPIGLGELDEVYHRIAADGTRLVAAPPSFRRRLVDAGGKPVREVTKAEAAAIVVELARRLGA
jgi:hypothetical protein